MPSHELSRLKEIAGPDQPLEELIRRRVEGEPLQYIEGRAWFGAIDLQVDQRVLVPRPETEGILEIATRMVRHPEVIIDLCTGSGALALALKKAFPAASVFATDISQDAIDVAYANKEETGLEVFLAAGDLFDPLPAGLLGTVDLLVSNPPYVAEHEFGSLPADVKREPRVALVAGPSGLEVIQRIGASAADWLRPGGILICEIGETQGVSASACFADLQAVVRKDLTGADRYIVAVKP
ncbi:MAG: peptide chain release factor N(5)-glutamine methyltransferase [Acidimicrobiia bacterium]|nr:peptide chain release factor N(5)-glutamine methyltransferase [Acidimicrobiia bacterium]